MYNRVHLFTSISVDKIDLIERPVSVAVMTKPQRNDCLDGRVSCLPTIRCLPIISCQQQPSTELR